MSSLDRVRSPVSRVFSNTTVDGVTEMAPVASPASVWSSSPTVMPVSSKPVASASVMV